jgi:hypothetical protein
MITSQDQHAVLSPTQAGSAQGNANQRVVSRSENPRVIDPASLNHTSEVLAPHVVDGTRSNTSTQFAAALEAGVTSAKLALLAKQRKETPALLARQKDMADSFLRNVGTGSAGPVDAAAVQSNGPTQDGHAAAAADEQEPWPSWLDPRLKG